MKKINKKMIFGLLIIAFILQIFFFGEISKSDIRYNDIYNNFQEAKYRQEETLLNNTVKTQQLNTLNAIRQSWINYTDNENKQLVLFDKNNNPIWNKEEIDNILNYIVAPIKSYGNEGGIIVYDSYSGEIFLDTTKTNRSIGSNIFLDYNNPNCKNINATKDAITSYLKVKKDSNTNENFIYLFDESENIDNPNDLRNYPLGKYNRIFIEKMILPYESFGFDGQPMQLTVLITTTENDIYSNFKDNNDNIRNLIVDSQLLNNKVYTILIVNIIISMIILSLIAYFLKYGQDTKHDEREDK